MTASRRLLIVPANRSVDGLSEFVQLDAPDDPWDLSGSCWVGAIVDDRSLSAALDLAMRGCALAVTETDEIRRSLLVDDCFRLGMVVIGEDPPPTPPWAGLLDALGDGLSVEQAAGRQHMSLRSAHRRLGEARSALGVTTNTAAVTEWRTRSAGAGDRPGSRSSGLTGTRGSQPITPRSTGA